MQVAVIESDGGLRCILCAFLGEDGYQVKDYTEIPKSYDGLDMVVFGPTVNIPLSHLDMLKEQHTPYLQLDYFTDMDKVMEQVATFARTEQCILEDR